MTNKQKAEQYFIDIGIMPERKDRTERWILHHIDWTMKYTNPERYEEWRVEDLLPMTIKQHQRLHMIITKINNDTKKYGRPKTEEQKNHLSEMMKGRPSPNKGNHFTKTPEAIERTRQAHLGRKHPGVGGRPKGSPATKGNSGMHWFTNGVNNVQCFECPEGYRRGRVIPR